MDRQAILEQIRQNAVRLSDSDDLNVLMEAIGDARYVLLGEASHGTSEFYTVRAELSRRLIQEKGFSFIAVEGDWPSCYSLNRYVKNYTDAHKSIQGVMQEFKRWPTWMWANSEVVTLAEWLKSYNEHLQNEQKIGFYGLDVYSLWESMDQIVHYLEKTGSAELETAKKAFSCFEPFGRDAQSYGISAEYLSDDCQDQVIKLLMDLQSSRGRYDQDNEASLMLELNALVAADAERYYRSMVRGGPDSWNIRDEHMVEALERLMDFQGSQAKAIIWEHNTHIGDARATDMVHEGMVNVGQLLRESHAGKQVFAIGSGTYQGSVIAARSWGAPTEQMKVPPAASDSWEELMHQAGNFDKILLLGAENPVFQQVVGHRAIGVVYHPEYEQGNYVPSNMAERYDAFVHIDETSAVHPLVIEQVLVSV